MEKIISLTFLNQKLQKINMKKIIVVFLIAVVLFVSGCISEIKAIGAESFTTGRKCSDIGETALSKNQSMKENLEIYCMELCGMKNMDYATFKCEADMLVCYCRFTN